jgi:hypothetical protein
MGEIVGCPIAGGGTAGMLIPKVKALCASLVASQDTGEAPSCPLSRFPDVLNHQHHQQSPGDQYHQDHQHHPGLFAFYTLSRIRMPTTFAHFTSSPKFLGA